MAIVDPALNSLVTDEVHSIDEQVTNPSLDTPDQVKTEYDCEIHEHQANNSNQLSLSSNNENISVVQSKRQMKREKKREMRQKMLAERKLQRKIKNRKRKSKNKELPLTGAEKPKICQMANSANKFNVVIDFSYDELMSKKDLMKCCNQVVRCYSANRRSHTPLQLHYCSFVGKIREEMSKSYEYKKWDIHLHEDSYIDIFRKEDLVYLTSDSRNVLEKLEEDKVYIIGGLVDHNAHKGVSYRKAIQEGIAHAQLPIKQHIHMKARSVLTINHVFEILLKVSNGESWTDALLDAIPQRYVSQGISNELKPLLIEDSEDNEKNTPDVEQSQPKPQQIID